MNELRTSRVSINDVKNRFQGGFNDSVFDSQYMKDYAEERGGDLKGYFTLSDEYRPEELDRYIESKLLEQKLSYDEISCVLCSKTMRKDIVEEIENTDAEDWEYSIELHKEFIDIELPEVLSVLDKDLLKVRRKYGLQIGSLSNQFYKPADGLGHLFKFPKEELIKHADRLTRILGDNGLEKEAVYREGDWGKDIITNVPGEYTQFLSELWDINRAISIGNTIGWNTFRIARNGILSQGVELDNNVKLSSFITDTKEIEEMSPFLRQNAIMQRMGIIIEHIKSSDYYFCDSTKLRTCLEFWANLDIETIEKLGEDNLDSSYIDIFHEFVEWVILNLDVQGKIEEHKIHFNSLIDSLNGDSGGFTLDTFLEGLETEGLRDTFEREFLDRQDHEDKYPNISRADLLKKTRGTLTEKFGGLLISKASQEAAGVKIKSCKVLLQGSTMIPEPIDENFIKELSF